MKLVAFVLAIAIAGPALAQEARRRWEIQRQIRLDKFEQVLPKAMRAHGIDMWIVAVKENHYDPLWNDLGRGYVSGIGYYVFTDRGADRIERAALGPSGYMLSESGAYDILGPASALAEHVKARDPKRIGLNMSDEIGPAEERVDVVVEHTDDVVEPDAREPHLRLDLGARVAHEDDRLVGIALKKIDNYLHADAGNEH